LTDLTAVSVRVQVRRLPHGADLPLPEPATAGSAGLDLRACLGEALSIAPGKRALIPTGIAVALPQGYEAQVRPRSGLALRTGLTLLNSPGTVDADYRGEVQVLVINLGDDPVVLERGDRIAQLVVQPVPRVEWEEVEALPVSVRGAGGFGHTGTR
jgi:dUTP pyrophosphatase